MSNPGIIKVGTSFHRYYRTINYNYKKVFKKYLMLHYPFFYKEGETLETRQINLTDYCIAKAGNLKNKRVLEVGCGNGIQTIYIYNTYNPVDIIGVDLNKDNVDLADNQKNDEENIRFYVDDAHALDKIPDNSVDVLICIESAFHYADKRLFLKQVERVLTEKGEFLVADILSKSYKRRWLIKRWKNKMNYFHWTENQYKNGFRTTNLKIEGMEDVTSSVIKGYQGYKNWIKRKDCDSFFKYFVLQIFMFIQVNLNLLLLAKRRKYLIITGVNKKNYKLEQEGVSFAEKETIEQVAK